VRGALRQFIWRSRLLDYRFGVLLRPLVCRSFWWCGWTDTLFAKLGFERWLERLGNVCGCEGLAGYASFS